MKKKNFFKLMAATVAVLLCLTVTAVGVLADINILAPIQMALSSGIRVSAVSETPGSQAGTIPIDVKDYTGIAHSATAGTINDFPRYYENTSNRDAARPRIAADEGVNNSNALRIGAMGAELKNYRLTFRFFNTGKLENNTEYVVGIKVKKDQGTVTTLKVGVKDNKNDPANLTFVAEGADINSSWTAYEWNYTTVYNCTKQWSSIVIELVAPEAGASVLIDDMFIYKASDSTKTNLMELGSFDTTVKKLPVTEIPGSQAGIIPVDVKDYTGIAHSASAGTINDFPRFYENTANRDAARPRIAADEGVNNSNALRIGALGAELKDYRLTFRFFNTGKLQNNTEYVVGIKVKKDQGTITNLKVGVKDNKTDPANLTLTVKGADVTDKWIAYEWRYTTVYECTKQWSSINIELNTPAEGASLLIDDMFIYKASDPTKTNLMEWGSFDTTCKKYPVDNTPVTDKIVPVTVFDYTNHGSTSVSTSDLPRFYYNEDYRNETRPLSVKDGVGQSYALQLGGAYGPIEDYRVEIRFPKKGQWKNNTCYTVSIKVKKSQGSISFLKLGFTEAVNSYPVTLQDKNVTAEWAEFVFEFTSTDTASKNWNAISINFAAPAGGATLQFDELRVWETLDSSKTDIYQVGNFEYVDLGQEPVNWNVKPKGTTVPVMDPASNKDSSGNDVVARIVACDAPSGDYCLALGFGEKATNCTVNFTLHSTKSGGSYRIGFWAKVVGDVNTAQVGMTDGSYRFIPYNNGYVFNQYQNGKWAYYEFIATDTGTFETNSSYRRFTVSLDAPAGSGILIDKVTVYDIKYSDSPDFMYMGDFEKSTFIPSIDWKSDERFITKKEGK